MKRTRNILIVGGLLWYFLSGMRLHGKGLVPGGDPDQEDFNIIPGVKYTPGHFQWTEVPSGVYLPLQKDTTVRSVIFNPARNEYNEIITKWPKGTYINFDEPGISFVTDDDADTLTVFLERNPPAGNVDAWIDVKNVMVISGDDLKKMDANRRSV